MNSKTKKLSEKLKVATSKPIVEKVVVVTGMRQTGGGDGENGFNS